jgi:hypothetical protein
MTRHWYRWFRRVDLTLVISWMLVAVTLVGGFLVLQPMLRDILGGV